LRLAVFTNQYPARVNTFFVRDLRALLEAGIELEIFSIYPLDARLWAYVPEILNDTLMPRDRIHHLRLGDCLRVLHGGGKGRLHRFVRDTAALNAAAARYGPLAVAKTAYVALKAWAWAAEHSERFDHVLAYWGNYAGSCAYLFHRLANRPVPFSLFLHAGTDLYRTPIYLRQKLLYADTIFTCNQFNRQFLRERYADIFDQIEPKLHVCYHGLDLGEFCCRLEGRPEARLIAVGTLGRAKGFDYLLQAIAQLHERGRKSVELELIGDGEEAKALKRLAARLGIDAHVRFRGHLPFAEVLAAMSEATVLVHPSSGLGDGLPNVLKEAMALGTPVIASDVAGISEGLDQGRCGILVPPKNVPALADAIERLLDDASLRCRYAVAARRHTEEKFDLWQNGKQLAGLLEASME
jgi:glycosyltransferase involved in cell wall biosynthesis